MQERRIWLFQVLYVWGGSLIGERVRYNLSAVLVCVVVFSAILLCFHLN